MFCLGIWCVGEMIGVCGYVGLVVLSGDLVCVGQTIDVLSGDLVCVGETMFCLGIWCVWERQCFVWGSGVCGRDD